MSERTSRRPSVRTWVAVAVTVLLLGGLAAVGVVHHLSKGYVTADGTSLELDGSPFRFVGFNLYDAAASDIYSCNPPTRLDDAGLMAAMRSIRDAGGTVVRFWAFQTYTAGGTDFTGVDRVLAAAQANGLRVIPVLENGQGDCSTGTPGLPLGDAENGTWYSTGYRSPYGDATISFRDYAADIAHHYRNDPTILAWSLMNEAETTRRDPDGQSVLVDFARDMSSVVHAADPHHLVTLGSQSNGAPGVSGSDFAAIYGLPGIDLAEVHDWRRYGSDVNPMPGALPDGSLPGVDQCQAPTAKIACSFVLARAMDKPVFVGEAGIRAETPAADQRRAALLGAKIDADFSAGASGYLVWQLNVANTDGYAVIVGSDDPLYGVLRDAAAEFVPADDRRA